jgi:hypothetical protein
MQTVATQYEADAEQALQQLRAAESNPDLRLGGQVFADDTTLAQAQARYSAAISQVSNATKELEEIQALARRLLTQRERLASDVTANLGTEADEITGRHAAKAVAVIKSKGALGRLGTGFEAAYQDVREGERFGTKILNPIIHI